MTVSDHVHHPDPMAPIEARVAAIESVLIDKGMFDAEQLDEIVRNFEHNLGPLNGAKVVAHAWVAPTTDPGCWLKCTLCSCYPWPTLRLPPKWYKAPACRSRAVYEPPALLAELGTSIPDDVEIRVWDSSVEVRYLVLPERRPGTEELSEQELTALVTRDSMIGGQRL